MLVKNRRLPHWFGKQALVNSERKSDGVDCLEVMTSASRANASIMPDEDRAGIMTKTPQMASSRSCCDAN
jgi:hypothetical protein